MFKKVAIVTGVNSGLGNAIALRLVNSGFYVIGVSRRDPYENEWQSKIEAGSSHHITGDVSNPKTVKETFAQAKDAGALELVVNCAGRGVFGPAGTFSRADIDDVLSGNLIGTILFSDTAFAKLRISGGMIVNVISTAAHVARANEAIYCASKWAVRGYTDSLRLEAKSTPVSVVSVYPGGMRTAFWESAKGSDVDSSGFMDPNEVADAIMLAIQDRKSCYVSDVFINRK